MQSDSEIQFFAYKTGKNEKSKQDTTKVVSLTTYHWKDQCSTSLVEVQIGMTFLESIWDWEPLKKPSNSTSRTLC